MITDKDREEARDIWEQIEKFSESLLGDGPLSVFSIARDSEPTKTMLQKEKYFAIGCIATKLSEAAEEARKEAADVAVEWVNKNLCDEHMPIMSKRLEEDELRAAILKEATE